jgi:histidyl-tRNA synthetase
MSKLSTQPYKGTRDYYPEDMRVRNWLFSTWRQVCLSFGYEEYDAPVLEPLELYTAKTSEEIVNEQTYSFTDRGDRKVVMRPEMTPSVSRMVAAKRQELAYPLRLFSIPNCFRYERPQRGRTREFWQLNADMFGVAGIEAEVEMLLLTDKLMSAFGAKRNMYEIRLNSRKLLNSQIEKASPKENASAVLRLIDKRDKMDEAAFTEALTAAVDQPTQLTAFLDAEDIGTIDDPAADGLKELLRKAENDGITNVRFVPSTARGFDYYTDIVFEVFDLNPDNNRSMFGGGRYDGLVAEFGVEPVPTLGIAPGDVTMLNFLDSWNLLPSLDAETDIYIAVVGDVAEGAQDIAQKLRLQGKNVAVDLSGRKLEKQIKTAEKKGIKQVLFVGEQELTSGQFTLKNLDDGTESSVNLDS